MYEFSSLKICLKLDIRSYLQNVSVNDSIWNDTSLYPDDALISSAWKASCYINLIFHIITAISIVFGTILNLLSFYCFVKLAKRHSQNIYLAVLSLSDTINLHINFALPIIRGSSEVDQFFRNSKLLCSLTGILTEFFLIFPAWIVVLLVAECLINVSYPTKRKTLNTRSGAKTSISVVAIATFCLSLYRLLDFKGIERISAFSIAACNYSSYQISFMRNFNLLIWAFIPECVTLIMSLIIIYRIKSTTQKFRSNNLLDRKSKYNQATRIVLLISILFLILHTPTGIIIALGFLYPADKLTLVYFIILVSSKLALIPYEISLSCKFFIYLQRFRNFKHIFHTSISRFTRRNNSAKIGRPKPDDIQGHHKRKIIHFTVKQSSITSSKAQENSSAKHVKEYPHIPNNAYQRTSSTNVTKSTRGCQSVNVKINKSIDDILMLSLLEKKANKYRRRTSSKR